MRFFQKPLFSGFFIESNITKNFFMDKTKPQLVTANWGFSFNRLVKEKRLKVMNHYITLLKQVNLMLKIIEKSKPLKRIIWAMLFYFLYKTSLDNLDKIIELIKLVI